MSGFDYDSGSAGNERASDEGRKNDCKEEAVHSAVGIFLRIAFHRVCKVPTLKYVSVRGSKNVSIRNTVLRTCGGGRGLQAFDRRRTQFSWAAAGGSVDP
jgi:hypothetical protein